MILQDINLKLSVIVEGLIPSDVAICSYKAFVLEIYVPSAVACVDKQELMLKTAHLWNMKKNPLFEEQGSGLVQTFGASKCIQVVVVMLDVDMVLPSFGSPFFYSVL